MNMSDAWQEQTGTKFLMLGLAAHQSWVEDNAEAAWRLTETVQEALRIMSSDPKLVGRYLRQLGLEPEVVETASERMSKLYASTSVSQARDVIRAILERTEQQGVISNVPESIFTQP